MLHVDTRLGPSPIHGIGLIATESIAAGREVWTLLPAFDLVLDEARFRALPPAARQTILYYAFFDLHRRCFVLSSDDDRFTNHSTTPNCGMQTGKAIALRDIAAGEEITVDYAELGWTQFLGLPKNATAGSGPRVGSWDRRSPPCPGSA